MGRDKSLASVVERYGMPPLWARDPGFPTLLHIILEQQVSLASAKTAFDRLCATIGDPPRLRNSSRSTMLSSRPSASVAKRPAMGASRPAPSSRAGLISRRLPQPTTTRRAELIKLPGIGNWTVDVYLLLALQRPDALRIAPTLRC